MKTRGMITFEGIDPNDDDDEFSNRNKGFQLRSSVKETRDQKKKKKGCKC